jgi:hypothetical protein
MSYARNNVDFRMAVEVRGAWRSKAPFGKPRGSNPAAKLGLRYERSVGRELERHVRPDALGAIEHNPWFTFSDAYGTSSCSPDYLIWIGNRVVIVEVKLTWVDVAMTKLLELYCPVVSIALGAQVMPLVICRNTLPRAPRGHSTLVQALTSHEKLLLWPQIGHIPWE